MGRRKVGVIGAGTVGAAVLELLHERGILEGSGLELLPVLVRDPAKQRSLTYPLRFSDDPSLLAEADILIELMGGTERALTLVQPHLERGLPLITANKALLALCWDVLEPHLRDGQIYLEAAVMAGTPVIGPLCTTLRASRPLEVHAVLSGTCNYMLSRMESGVSYREALQEAQRRGYAEDPPTLDVGGLDAAHKLCLLARLSVDPGFAWERIEVRGIDSLEHLEPGRLLDLYAQGKRVKLVASLVPEAGSWHARVRPLVLGKDHPLALGQTNQNTLVFRGDCCGEVIFQGPGAGALETASAVVGDLLALLADYPGHRPLLKPVAVPEHTAEGFEAFI